VRVEGAFQQTLETALILAFANPIFLFHRPTPLSRNYCATRFVTIIRVGRKDRTVPLGLAKNGAVRVIALRTRVGGSVRRQSGGAGYRNKRPVQLAPQGVFVGRSTEMPDLRQRNCPISTPTHCKKTKFDSDTVRAAASASVVGRVDRFPMMLSFEAASVGAAYGL